MFLLSMFFVNVVLLNMLIALMSDTWGKNIMHKEYMELLGKGQLLVAFDLRMSEDKLDNEEWYPKLLHVIKKRTDEQINLAMAEESAEVIPVDPEADIDNDGNVSEMERLAMRIKEVETNLAEKMDARIKQ